jgi:hypothetical protein
VQADSEKQAGRQSKRQGQEGICRQFRGSQRGQSIQAKTGRGAGRQSQQRQGQVTKRRQAGSQEQEKVVAGRQVHEHGGREARAGRQRQK